MKKIKLIVFFISILGLTSCNQNSKKNTSSEFADAIYFGGDIITMEGNKAQYIEAIAIKNGKIILVGTKEEAEQLQDENTKMNDLKGKTLLPGFIDAHSHILTVADGTVQANLSPSPVGKVATIADIISSLKELKKQLQEILND